MVFTMIRFLILMQSKMLPKRQFSGKKLLMVIKRMRKFRERNKKFIVSDLYRKRECKGRPAFLCGDVICYLKLEF